MIIYQRQSAGKPLGCGGYLLLIILGALLLGGAPWLINIFGMILFGLVFVVLTAMAFSWVFSLYIRRQIRRYEQSQSEIHNIFVFLLVHILVRIAQLDHAVTRAETTAINEFFRIHLGYNYHQLLWVKELIGEAITSTLTLDDLLTEFRRRFDYEPRLILLELIYRVSYTSEKVSAQELLILQRIADFLEIQSYDHQAIRAQYQARARGGVGDAVSRDVHHYHTMGLEPGADFEQIKKAYRNLSKQYHPDKVNHLGEEFRRVAEEKMKEINESYHYFKKQQTQN
ncbi:MAG: J domain-containing protein [Desulfobulbaceae bacterium]|nr:MAG: J domain-containing protein [Desulfobulbaceae bacterium]